MSNLVFVEGTPVEVDADATIGDLYKEYGRQDVILIYAGEDLMDMSTTLADLGICPESYISSKEWPLLLYMGGEHGVFFVGIDGGSRTDIQIHKDYNLVTKSRPHDDENIHIEKYMATLLLNVDIEKETTTGGRLRVINNKIYDTDGVYFDIEEDTVASMADGFMIELDPIIDYRITTFTRGHMFTFIRYEGVCGSNQGPHKIHLGTNLRKIRIIDETEQEVIIVTNRAEERELAWARRLIHSEDDPSYLYTL